MDNKLVHKKEKFYYTLCLIISILIYLGLIISLVGIPYLIGLLIASVFLHGLMVGNILNNGVKLTEKQFPNIYARVIEMCRRMEIKKIPDVYIIQSDGILNAFASRFFGRNFVVLYSDIVELEYMEGSDELDFVIAHELAHIKRKHVSQYLIMPALWLPYLGSAYSRACEFTCDRMAAFYTGKPQSAVYGLAILAVGKELYRKINIADYLLTYHNGGGFFRSLSRILSTHPPLPVRIKEVEKFMMQLQNYSYQQASHSPSTQGAMFG